MNIRRVIFLIIFMVSLVLFITYEVMISNVSPQFTLSSIFSEGTITILALLSLVAIQWIEGSNKLYYILTAAISCLLFSYVADTLDDVVTVDESFSILFEDSLQLIGYSLMTLGIIFWVKQTQGLMKQLVVMAHTDKLTGAYNRHKLNEVYERELERAKRYKLPLSLILFDLDHFKQVNDTFGHATGDHVLTSTSEIVSNEIRDSDHFARIGGEEFVILNPSTNLDGANASAEKVRGAIEKHLFEDVNDIRASFGVTTCEPGESLENALHRADIALYEAKDQGRNRVVSYKEQE